MPSSSFSTPYSLEIDLLRSDTRGIFMLPRPPCFLGVLTLKREREKKPQKTNKQTFFLILLTSTKHVMSTGKVSWLINLAFAPPPLRPCSSLKWESHLTRR